MPRPFLSRMPCLSCDRSRCSTSVHVSTQRLDNCSRSTSRHSITREMASRIRGPSCGSTVVRYASGYAATTHANQGTLSACGRSTVPMSTLYLDSGSARSRRLKSWFPSSSCIVLLFWLLPPISAVFGALLVLGSELQFSLSDVSAVLLSDTAGVESSVARGCFLRRFFLSSLLSWRLISKAVFSSSASKLPFLLRLCACSIPSWIRVLRGTMRGVPVGLLLLLLLLLLL